MQRILAALVLPVLMLTGSLAWADEYTDTIEVFKKAGESSKFFANSYGYAVFPSIGKGGLGVGAAHGKGRVYEQGKYVGDTSMTQVSVGFQAGGQAYSQIVFFQDKRSFDEFTSGNFEFSAGVSAVAITAGVSGSAGTSGSSTGASELASNRPVNSIRSKYSGHPQENHSAAIASRIGGGRSGI